MTKHLFIIAAALLLCLTAGAQPKSRYNKEYNQKRIKEVTLEILKQVEQQQEEYRLLYEAWQKKGNNSNQNSYDMPPPGMGPGMPPGAGPSNQPAADAPVDPGEFKIDNAKITLALVKKYGDPLTANNWGASRSVDVRSEIELRDSIAKEMANDPKYNRTMADFEQEELKHVEDTYPLYQEGQNVEISYSIGNEPRRTYIGTYRKNGRFRIFVGRNSMNLKDLPELLRARFDPELNEQCRKKLYAQHPLYSKYQLEKEDEIKRRYDELLRKQMEKNLPRGWVYINNVWKVPADLIEDVLENRKMVHSRKGFSAQSYTHGAPMSGD